MVAYVSTDDPAKDSGGGAWKLFARQTDNNRAQFYMMPTNANYDVKIPITDGLLADGQPRLRDVYTIPDTLRFDTPLLSHQAYQVVELPKSDLTAIGASAYM
jgi:hypothetical protein